ncbi:UNVERIFIED_CONTAM: hypothetical protein RMT77_016717 [Armadillidium vulgare]
MNNISCLIDESDEEREDVGNETDNEDECNDKISINVIEEDEQIAKIIEKAKLDPLKSGSSPRRGSKGNIFCKVGSPARSFSFNTTRDKVKTSSKMAPPKSPPMLMKRPKSPQSLSASQNSLSSNGSPLSKRSLGLPDSKLVVLGSPSVGKSAIVVRIMTGRFIWEYDPTLEAVYRYNTTVDDDQAIIEILDTAGMVEGKINEGQVKWGDGFLIVYSLIDRNSFLAVPNIHSAIASVKHTPNFPCVILANKSDLVHLSEVCPNEASALASDLGVSFFLASACEGSSALWEAFSELHRDVVRRYRNRRRRSSAKVVIEGFYKMFSR